MNTFRKNTYTNKIILSFESTEEINGLGKFMEISPNLSFASIQGMWLSSFTLKRTTGDLPSMVLLSLGGEVNPNGTQLQDTSSPTLDPDMIRSNQYAPVILNGSGNPSTNRTHVYAQDKVDFSNVPDRGILHRLRVFIRNKDGTPITGPYTVEMVIEYIINREQFFSNNL